MAKLLTKLIALGFLLLAGSLSFWFYRSHTAEDRRHAQDQQKIAQLEEQKQVLNQVVQRLSDEKRVAEVLVTDQRTVDGVLRSTLLLVEMDRSGKSLPPRRFVVVGDTAHIDALVIKFERDFIAQNDPLRGHSIALFTRIYGDRQAPSDGTLVDPPGQIPAIYRAADPKVSDFELSLWRDFWRLADDPTYREKYGVRVANGQGVWGPFELDKLYTITLESDGGLNIASEPLKPIYKELIRSRMAESQ